MTSVLEQAFPGEVEVTSVDNASRDGSAEYVRQTFPPVTVVESGGNLGYAGGNNLGADQARGEILVFLNPDADFPTASGCSFAIRADLFRKLGGFDHSFFTYLEDTELSWRARGELRQHSPRPPVVGDAGGLLGRVVQSALGPLFDAAARVGLALLPVSSGDPADRQCREETASTEGNVGQDGSIRDLQVRLAGGPD